MKNEKLKEETISLPYYGRHHLPQLNTNPPTLAGKINRNFYRSLRLRGRTHSYIMGMMQPERTVQFLKDVQFIAEYMDRTPKIKTSTLSLWSKIKRKFNLLFIIILITTTFSINAQTPEINIVSVISEKKDTLFLANNSLGCEIMDVWVNYPKNQPIIILKSEDWIVRENKKRKESEK